MKSNEPTRCRIMIVDRNLETLACIATLFQPYGFDLLAASTAGVAVTQAELFHPHAVCMGLEYDDCDGWELAARLRKVPGLANILLVGLLARGNGWRTIDSAGSHGFDYYFPKPPRMRDIVMALTKEVRSRED